MEGIKKRLVYNYILLILGILLVLEIGFLITIRSYYYGNISKTLLYKAEHSTQYYGVYLSKNDNDLQSIILQLIKDSSATAKEEELETQVLDLKGNILFSTSGFILNDKVATKDYNSAVLGEYTVEESWNIATKERVVSASSPLMTEDNKVVGVIRYVTSLSEVNKAIFKIVIVSMIFILFIVMILLGTTLLFSRSIINPINEINEVAKKMTQGHLMERTKRHYNDEIGELADTLNYMAEELINTNKLKNDFISSVSHELRTPLTAIRGWGETILTGDMEDKEETRMGLNIIVKETNRLSRMVEELLDFSKIEGGRITLHLEDINIKKEIEEVINITVYRAEKEGIKLIYENMEDDIPNIIGDRNRLKQVFINILDNAIKFTPEGKNIYVSMKSENERVHIVVRDEGIGIEESDTDKVLEKFHKGSSKKSGSGIGLAISNDIMKLHGGRLIIHSEENVGTEVTMELVLEDKDKGEEV